MAGTKISALTAVAAALSADEIPVNEAGTTKKVTLTQIWTLLQTLAANFSNSFTVQSNLSLVGNLNMSGVGAHINLTGGGTPATGSLGANVTSVTFTGNDVRGTIAIVMSGALAANTRIATCTYNVSYGASAPIVVLANETSGVGLANVNFYRQAVSTGVSFDLAANQGLVAGTYTCAYVVMG